MNHQHQTIKAHNFSVAFEQMCSMVAIGKTGGNEETLKELILHCFVFLPDENYLGGDDLVRTINELFGLDIPIHEIEFFIEQLLASNLISISADKKYLLQEDTKKAIQERIDVSYALETRVRNGWEEELAGKFPLLDAAVAWKALRNYLARAFQRHGMQTAALLDPSIEIAIEYSESLSAILSEVVSREFDQEQHLMAKKAISDFMATTGSSPDRATYISELADGAFNYFSLTISPETASNFRKNLSTLLLFLDTNFLFGILDLDVGPQVGVSNELLRAIEKHNLPFQLKTHPKTIKELLSTIEYYSNKLKNQKWSRQISRAAVTSRYLSGVELRYHQRYAEEGIDVDSFFKPFRHADVILKEKTITSYNAQNNRVEERSKLISAYKEFLEKWNRDKPYEVIDHDMTVLHLVRGLRLESNSTLEAGALFITCDYTLYRFDWETSKKLGIIASTVLPNIFWQVLRPFIPSDADFNRSFAETFAIPEFRILGSRASEACSKMLNILAGYKDLPEETAARMLSNDILIDKLRTAESDQVFQEYVKTAIVDENSVLVEEKAMIEQQLSREKVEKRKREIELKEEQARRIEDDNAARKREALIKEDAEAQVSQEKETRKEIEENVQKERERYQIIIAILSSIIVIGLFEWLIYIIPFIWLISHQYSVLLQIIIDVMIFFTTSSIVFPKWRKILLSINVIALIVGTLVDLILAN